MIWTAADCQRLVGIFRVAVVIEKFRHHNLIIFHFAAGGNCAAETDSAQIASRGVGSSSVCQRFSAETNASRRHVVAFNLRNLVIGNDVRDASSRDDVIAYDAFVNLENAVGVDIKPDVQVTGSKRVGGIDRQVDVFARRERFFVDYYALLVVDNSAVRIEFAVQVVAGCIL